MRDDIKWKVAELASAPVPPHVKYWQGVFRVVEMYEEPEQERLQDYAIFATVLEHALSRNKSHFMILDSEWAKIYYLPADIEMLHAEGGAAGIRFLGFKPGVVRYARQEKRPDGKYDNLRLDIMPKDIDATESFTQIAVGLPLYAKLWDKPPNAITVVSEADEAVRLLDEVFRPYLCRAETDYVEIRDGNIFDREVDWPPKKGPAHASKKS